MTPTPNGPDHLDSALEFDTSRALDGNAAAGAFTAAFGRAVDTADIVCAACADRSLFSQKHAYLDGPGATLRCPRCGQALARLASTPHGTWLSLAGSASWHLRSGI
jgi:hypothetical protein